MTLEQFLFFCQEFQLSKLPKTTIQSLALIYHSNCNQNYGMSLLQFQTTLRKIAEMSFEVVNSNSTKNKNAKKSVNNMTTLFKCLQISNDDEFHRKADRLGIKTPQLQGNSYSVNKLKRQNDLYDVQADDDKILASYLLSQKRSRSLANMQNSKHLQSNIGGYQKNTNQAGSYAQLNQLRKMRNQKDYRLGNQQSTLKLNKIVYEARKAYAGHKLTQQDLDIRQRSKAASRNSGYLNQIGTNSMVFANKNHFNPEQQTEADRQQELQRRNQIQRLNELKKMQREQDQKRREEIKRLEQLIKQQKVLSELIPKTDSGKLNDLIVTKQNASQLDKSIYIHPKSPQTQGSRKDLASNNLKVNKSNSMGFAQVLNSQFEKSQKPKLTLTIQRIRNSIIGFNTKYLSPFQLQLQTVYIDHTATNRPCRCIETMIQFAKKTIANPHTEFSHFGKYSTDLMHYAQDSLLKSFSVDTKEYVALPAGSGSTGAIEKCMKMLKSIQQIDKLKPAVFMTPYEHHSNILPWVEFYEDVKVLPSDQNQNLKIDQIQKLLTEYPANKIIVSVSAASNVTSQITPLLKLNQIIKKVKLNKQIVFCTDCAAFCCHHDLNLALYDQIDFAFLSPHKNLGGAQSCGVLIAKKKAAALAKPTFPGGGTVNFVKGFTKQDVLYDQDIFAREIAGTPPFLGFYRAALSFELLHAIGYDLIHERQKRNTVLFLKKVNEGNQKMKTEEHDTRIEVYGDQHYQNRANVITFNFTYGDYNYVHHSVASLIFTDVFGIQLRSGCFCAGPFGKQLLHVNQKIIDEIENQVRMGIVYRKPGYIRLDLTFYLQPFEIEYIAEACITICKFWRKIEKFYTVCSNGQVIRHQFIKAKKSSSYGLENLEIVNKYLYQHENIEDRQQNLKRQLENGKQLMKDPLNFMKNHMKTRNSKPPSEKSDK